MKYHSDYDTYGFRSEQILSILKKNGIFLELEKSDQPAIQELETVSFFDWQKSLALRSRLSVYEAVCAMGWIDPFTEGDTVRQFGSNESIYDMHYALLNEALEDGLIDFKETKEGHLTERFIDVKSFSAWCDKKQIPRPLPWAFDTAAPLTDPELQQALIDANNEITALKAQIQSLTEELSEGGLGAAYAGILDKNSAFHPPELFAAMRAWHAVTKSGNPREKGKGVTQALVTWLKNDQTEYKLSNKAITRLATVANWNKDGGTPPTPK